MNWIRRNYVATIIIWLFLTVVSVVTLPDISALIRQKGQVTLPVTSESFQAYKLNKQMQTGKNSSSVVIVYHNKSKLNQEDQRKINDRVKQLARQKKNYQVTKITSTLNGKEVAKQVISRNRQTELVNVDVEKTANFDHQAQQIKCGYYHYLYFYCISAGFSFVNHSPSFVIKCRNCDDYFPKFSDEPC